MLSNNGEEAAQHPNEALIRNQLTRCSFLGAGAATVVLATAGSALAQQPVPAQQAPRVKGPRVWLDMDQALSSQRHLDKLNAPVIVAYGTLETPEFQRQSRVRGTVPTR